jgi:uncharacterized protein YyaL (SSP411 family)
MQEENLLRHERSPYLLQHAGNPVHWQPWGDAALQAARASHRPILLSIGYAACHWCHVMAHESFEDPQTAGLMNELFVNIKVDREERPDIDHIYMTALHALGEQGGWPLTMFLTPDGDPFWGGTYFPPEPRWGRPSFRQVLGGVAQAWAKGDDAVAQNVAALRQALAAMSATRPGGLPDAAALDAAAASLLDMTDRRHGGLRGAPRFPNAPLFRFLWQNACRRDEDAGRQAVRGLLRGMSQGGIYDHLGGGYARYSTDGEWLVPHFEKMLYDNAQILELLAFVQADTPDPLWQDRAAETVGWLLRDMRTGGAFAASEDADSEGEEGRFYVWTAAEIAALLGPAAARFAAAYDVTPQGNWEGHTILRRLTPRGDAASEVALAADRDVLFRARAARIRPGRDDKVLADWNGLAIAALCRAGAVFRRPDWIALAGEACDFVQHTLAGPDGRVQHAWRDRITAAGLLEDQAAMARAALALFEATGEASRLDQARGLAEAALAWFADEDGSFYTTASDAADVPAGRPRNAGDNATPSGNGMIAEVFARLYHLTGEDLWRRRAEAVLVAFGGAMQQAAATPGLLAAADLLMRAATVVVAGAADDPRTAALLDVARAAADPAVCVLYAAPGQTLPASHPAHGKADAHAAPAAFVCHAGTCGLPVADPAALALMLRGAAA